MGLRRVATIVAGLAVATVTATAAVPASAATVAPDVPATAPIRADVAWVVGQGVVPAYGDGTYRPATSVTRRDMALYLYRVTHLHGTPPTCTKAPFADVPVSSASCGAVAWLSTSGAQPGAATAKFAPTSATTRQTLAAWLYRTAKPRTALPTCKSSAFTDVPATSGYCGVIAWAYGQGVLVGTTGSTFAPGSAVTRGVAATALHRFYDVLHPVLGADVSHPQCLPDSSAAGPLPRGQAFAVVGVNAGVANTTNPCLAAELAWAATSTGGSAQPRVQLYVNTAEPGKALASSWPARNTGTNPYGTCANTDSTACAYEYGKARATEDATARGVSNPAKYVWWLDVESDNSWMIDTRQNVASLDGMVDYFRSIGAAGVGIYSSSASWTSIVGNSASSRLKALPEWLLVPRTTSAGAARRNCGLPPLTSGGRIVLTQLIGGDGFDHDHSCV